MKLKTKLLLATSAIVLLILGLSEWIGYRHTAEFLSGHEARMATEMNHEKALTELQRGRRTLLVHLATLHSLHAVFTIVILVIALNALWSRTVLRPLTDLLRHINYMGRGNWTTPVPVRSRDEIGELTEAFNDLGGRLTLAVHQFAAASKLSAMALLGQLLVKKVVSAADLVRASETALQSRHAHGEAVDPAHARLRVAIRLLEEIPQLFEAEFQRQFSLHSTQPSPHPADSQKIEAAIR